MKTPQDGSPPLQHPQYSRHEVTLAVTRAGILARYFAEHNTTVCPTFSHVEASAGDNILSALRRLGFDANTLLLDIVL